jgi:hypothetical protein
MIHDDQETWRSQIWMGGGLRWVLGCQSGAHQELANLDDLGTRKILGVGFVHDVALAGDLEHKLAVGFLVGVANLRDQSDDGAPFEVMGRRMTEYRLERAPVRVR